jgi:hypothetical protein
LQFSIRRKQVSALKTKLLILTFAAFQFFADGSAAQPTVINYGHFTRRFGPHVLPDIPVGDKVHITALLDSDDPVDSPTISVQAIQNGTTLMLDPLPPNDVFPGQHGYYKFIDFDPALMGSWEIIPTDSTGTGPSIFTNPIVDPELVPLVENIKVQGMPLGAKVSWTLPNLSGFDVDGALVGILEADSGRQVYQSNLFSAHTTSFHAPAGILKAGVDYVWGIVLGDLEGDYAENASNAFSDPFRYTIAGDFNTDGTVDAADYVVWRKIDGTQTGYNVWRANFGTSLSVGSGSTAYPLGAFALPLSAAVPEPDGLLLMTIAAATLAAFRRFSASSDTELRIGDAIIVAYERRHANFVTDRAR